MAPSSSAAVSRARRGRAPATMLLAGWLFADLALALVVILLATATDFPTVAVEASPSPTPTPSPTPSAEPTVVGVEVEPVRFPVRANADALLSGNASEESDVAEAIQEELEPYQDDGRQAALVLTFGASSEDGEGVRLATLANDILDDAVPDFMDKAVTRNFWQSTRSGEYRRGELLFEIYLFLIA